MSEVAERLRRRYPRSRVPRPLVIGLVGLLVVVGLTWLTWAGLFHAQPPVSAQVSGFSVPSDTEMVVTLTVDRRDPAQPVSCLVTAQGADFASVGEQRVPVPGAQARLVDVTVTLVTLRRAATAKVADCALS